MAEMFSQLSEQLKNKNNDVVISGIKELISNGELKPGDKLPAERKLSQDFGVGRTQVREALHKLEFYGIIKTLPQSGSILNGLDINTLDGLISDVLHLQEYDFFSLVETRYIIELKTVRFCAERWNDDDMMNLENAHQNFLSHYEGPDRVSHDFAFHRAIAEASHNPVFKAMLMILIPDIMNEYLKDKICTPNSAVITEHTELLEAIKKRDADRAEHIMAKHLQGVLRFASEKLIMKQ